MIFLIVSVDLYSGQEHIYFTLTEHTEFTGKMSRSLNHNITITDIFSHTFCLTGQRLYSLLVASPSGKYHEC